MPKSPAWVEPAVIWRAFYVISPLRRGGQVWPLSGQPEKGEPAGGAQRPRPGVQLSHVLCPLRLRPVRLSQLRAVEQDPRGAQRVRHHQGPGRVL